MTRTRKIVGQLSGLAALMIGGAVFLTIFAETASYWIGGSEGLGSPFDSDSGPGITWVITLVIILGFGLGASVGNLSWMFAVTRIGWDTWDEIDEMFAKQTHESPRTKWLERIPPWVQRSTPWVILVLVLVLIGASIFMNYQNNRI